MIRPQDESLAPGEGRAAKVSVSMPEGTVRAIRDRVGARHFSRFVAQAAEREIRRQSLDDLIAAHERDHGRVPDELVERAEASWQAAERRQDEWLDAESA